MAQAAVGSAALAIDANVSTNGTKATANSVTLIDLTRSLNDAPVLDNLGTLTVGTTLTLSADAILHNFGTINVGTKLELQDQGTAPNQSVLAPIASNRPGCSVERGCFGMWPGEVADRRVDRALAGDDGFAALDGCEDQFVGSDLHAVVLDRLPELLRRNVNPRVTHCAIKPH